MVEEELKGRDEQIVSRQSLQHQKMRLTHPSQTPSPPQELQSTVASFKEEVRHIKELL